MHNSSLRIGMALGLACALLAGADLTLAQVKQGKSRPLKTSQLMEGLIKPNYDTAKKVLKGKMKRKKEWAQLAMHAALLNEASYILMDDGRCPDAVWADAASKTLRSGTEDLLKAIAAQDLAAAQAACSGLSKSCKACHDKHKD